MLTYVFRKRLPGVFSIEKLFDTLYDRYTADGMPVRRLELPHVSTGLVSVIKNCWYTAVHSRSSPVHITGDVHYAALFRPFATTIITVHDCIALTRGSALQRMVMRWLWFVVPLRLATVVTVISERTRSEVLAATSIAAAKVVVIPNFVDPSYRYEPRSFATERPRILHVGTTPNKNLPRVIEALHDLNCVLVIVGLIPDELRQRLDQGATVYENWVAIDHAAMRGLYQTCDLVSFPSLFEGFGMPIVEGQAVGRPILTSALEPMQSVAGADGALFVDPHSVASIRGGFLALLGEPELRSRLVAAGLLNCRRFAFDSVASQYRDLYRRLGVESAPPI